MADLSGGDLLREWQGLMESLVSSAASAAGSELPHQLVSPMQRQLELVHEVMERERRLQAELTGRIMAPLDAVFDLLEQSGALLQRQARALETAGHALDEASRVMKLQAELFERAIGVLRQPSELAKAAAGVERRPRRRAAARKPATPAKSTRPARAAKAAKAAGPAKRATRR